jgi:hypothetical protein
MQTTVLAGAIEFSPAEIALIVAVVVAAFVLVTAPGWFVLAVVAGRRAGPGRPGRQWVARVGGALAGLALSVLVGSLVSQAAGDLTSLLGVLGAWCACWVLAAMLRPARSAPAPVVDATSTVGWGR